MCTTLTRHVYVLQTDVTRSTNRFVHKHRQFELGFTSACTICLSDFGGDPDIESVITRDCDDIFSEIFWESKAVEYIIPLELQLERM